MDINQKNISRQSLIDICVFFLIGPYIRDFTLVNHDFILG